MRASTSAEGARLESELSAERIGTSMWGVVYRSLDNAHWYRLIPGDQGATADQRAEMSKLIGRPSQPGIAPAVQASWLELNGRWFVVVSYEGRGERTLVQSLSSEHAVDRVASIAAMLRAMPGWWRQAGSGLIPMPSDIVFVDGTPHLLAVPPLGVPAIDALFEEPERALYLAPEIVRGNESSVTGSTSDLFALGVMLLKCLVVLPTGDAGRLLQQVASDVAFVPAARESRLPFWLRKSEAVRHALLVARRLIDPDPRVRSGLDPFALAAELEECLPAMNPVSAVRELRHANKLHEAMELAQAALLEEPSYELLLLMAEIAVRHVGDPLEALSLLDKAVAAAPRRSEAYAAQFALIGDLRTNIMARLVHAIDRSFSERLDVTMDTAFAHLPAQDQSRHEGAMAQYLIERGHLLRANTFIHGRLHEGATLLWWKFDLMIAYAETFLRLDRLDSAASQVEQVKRGLRRVSQQRTMPGSEIEQYATELAQLEFRLLERMRDKGSR